MELCFRIKTKLQKWLLLLLPPASISHLVTSMFHYTGAVNGESSPHFTSSHPNTLWQLLPLLGAAILISCNILHKLYEWCLVNQS